MWSIYVSILVSILSSLVQCVQVVNRRIPEGSVWQSVGTSKPSDVVSFSISLWGARESELDQKMLAISTSRSAWLTSVQLAEYLAPESSVKSDLEDHLITGGVSKSALKWNEIGNVLHIVANVNAVENILNTTLTNYRNSRTGQVQIKTTQAFLPVAIAAHVASVDSLTTFEDPHKYVRRHPVTNTNKRETHLSTREIQQGPSFPTGPSAPHQPPPGCISTNTSYPCMARYYGYEGYTPAQNSESIAVLAYGGLWTDASLHSFVQNFRPDAGPEYLPNKLAFGNASSEWNNVSGDDGEDILDIEILVGIAYPLQLSTIAVNADFGDAAQSLIDMPDATRPGVVSVSYGIQESDSDYQTSLAFCRRVQHLAALGTTFLTATGDNGVANNNASNCPPFQTDFISSCPYVVGVGATTGFSPERAVFLRDRPQRYNGWSSGGFSTFYPMPSYQKNFADRYLRSIAFANGQYYNTTGRGFPDVAAFGEFINLAEGGGLDAGGAGTSASSPIFASVLALVNAKCKENGKPRIGWVHPTFYANRKAFGDITYGGTYDCANTDFGFPCRESWDPATGLGSPTFDALVAAFGCN